MHRATILAALLLTPWTAIGDEAPAVHVVDLAHTHQIVDHFGASDCWTTRILGTWPLEARRRARERTKARRVAVVPARSVVTVVLD